MTRWKRVDEYGIRKDSEFFVCKTYVDGCTLYVGHKGDECVGHHEDLAEILVRLFWPDADEMKAFLESMCFAGWIAPNVLREQCREAWAEKKGKK